MFTDLSRPFILKYMIKRITRLLILCFVAGLCIYFVTINQKEITLAVSDQNSLTASSGIIVLAAFSLGILVATLAGALYAFQGFLRERKLLKNEKLKALYDQAILEARSFSASGDYKRAKLAWEKLISKHPNDLLPRLELAEVYQKLGEHQQALKALDEARQLFPHNDELHYRAASLHTNQGNLTAAIDNLALIISQNGSSRAVKSARDLSITLQRYEDALEYNERLKEIEGGSPQIKETVGDLRALILIRDLKNKPEELSSALTKHLMSFERSIPALTELSKLKLAEGCPDEAAQCLHRAFKVSLDSAHIREARTIWLNHGFKDKALSSIKTWVRDAIGCAALEARLELAKTYLLIGQDSDASYEIDQLERESYAQTHEAKRDLAIMKAIIAYRSRDSLRSIEAFKEVEVLELEQNSIKYLD